MPWPAIHDDPLFGHIEAEVERQNTTLQLIASENFASPAVLAATGSVLTNKYAEGYPGRRYYGGNQIIDEVEELARTRARELFGAEHANVQPHSGANANMAVYQALLKPGETVLGMALDQGGHLTHGSPGQRQRHPLPLRGLRRGVRRAHRLRRGPQGGDRAPAPSHRGRRHGLSPADPRRAAARHRR